MIISCSAMMHNLCLNDLLVLVREVQLFFNITHYCAFPPFLFVCLPLWRHFHFLHETCRLVFFLKQSNDRRAFDSLTGHLSVLCTHHRQCHLTLLDCTLILKFPIINCSKALTSHYVLVLY